MVKAKPATETILRTIPQGYVMALCELAGLSPEIVTGIRITADMVYFDCVLGVGLRTREVVAIPQCTHLRPMSEI
jgi:hypothetical protein